MKKNRRLVLLIILASVLLLACKKTETVSESGESIITDNAETVQNNTEISSPVNVNEINEDNSEEIINTENLSNEVENEQEKKPVIIDGYDITASVSGMPLKKAYEKYFKIGVGLNGSSVETATVRSAAMSEIIKYHFNSVTYSNLMKPAYLLNQEGSIKNYNNGIDKPAVDFSTVIEGLEFCKENNIQMRGHVLVWHNQVPEWFFKEGYRDEGEFVNKDTMLKRLESYIEQVLTYTQEEYPGVIYCWDVVNEAVEISPGSYETESGFNIRTKYDNSKDNLWYKVVGVDYVEKAFEYARKYAAKDVKLFYNDYNTFQPAKTLKIYELASYLKEKNLIDGIGMQGYMDLTYPGIAGGNDSFMTALSKFAELGLEIHITELTINSPDKSEESMQKQAKRYETLFQILVGMDTESGRNANITSVTVFGLMDEYMFYPNDTTYARLFDKNLQPKPAFYSILSVGEK
ncbi:MAG TPA: endo-1,4-beta-xylanase [Mobilitalea sp.]|nr:endo-1,4-beta-xylanase [Mobilitalea sp.]